MKALNRREEEELDLVQTKCSGETWEEANKRNEHFTNVGIEKGKQIQKNEELEFLISILPLPRFNRSSADKIEERIKELK